MPGPMTCLVSRLLPGDGDAAELAGLHDESVGLYLETRDKRYLLEALDAARALADKLVLSGEGLGERLYYSFECLVDEAVSDPDVIRDYLGGCPRSVGEYLDLVHRITKRL